MGSYWGVLLRFVSWCYGSLGDTLVVQLVYGAVDYLQGRKDITLCFKHVQTSYMRCQILSCQVSVRSSGVRLINTPEFGQAPKHGDFRDISRTPTSTEGLEITPTQA